jgi:hypothetical protein
MRWPDGVCCFKCGSVNVYKITRERQAGISELGFDQCLEKDCKAQFTATAGTLR